MTKPKKSPNFKERLVITSKEKEQFAKDARPAALRLASVAVEKNSPCGLREVLDAVFGSEIDMCKDWDRRVAEGKQHGTQDDTDV